MLRKVAVFAGLGLVAVIIFIAISTRMTWFDFTQESQTSQPTLSSKQASNTSESTINAEASQKQVWEELGLPYDPNKGEPTELTAEDIKQAQIEEELEQELLQIDAKEGTSFRAAMEDQRVKDEVKGALQVSSDFIASENRPNSDTDKLTLTVTGKEILEGSWETSYTSILTGMFALEIEMKDGAILSIEKKPLDDIRMVFTYTDAEKAYIRMALDDPAVMTELKEKEDAGKTVSVSFRSEKLDFPAYNCPMNQCTLVLIREVNTHATLEVWLNTGEAKVVRMKEVAGW